MEEYQKEFIKLAIDKQVLRFGKFTLKSGRISPYFFNSSLFNDGKSLAKLGRLYAAAIIRSGVTFDMIYGPAYKGIPLASTLSIALQEAYKKNYPFCFNRKEIKDHGERGDTFGADIAGKIVIIDDVISAGTAIRESLTIINNKGGKAVATIVAVDRQERGQKQKSAKQEIEQTYNIKVISIITLEQIVQYLSNQGKMQLHLDAINAYKVRYGIT